MGFNRKSTAEQVTEGLDLTGKTIVITGVNSGLGLESMRVLCLRGAHVIGLARTLEKARQACDSVAGKTTPLACELSELASVKAAGESIRTMAMPIDVLITNAGIMAPNQQVSVAIPCCFRVRCLQNLRNCEETEAQMHYCKVLIAWFLK